MSAPGASASPAAPTSRYAIRPGTLLSLLAGRGTYRLVQLGAAVALLPIWGERRYGWYAGAAATFSWLIALLLAGPEKTVLKLLPRMPRTGPLLVRALAGVLWLVPVPPLLVFAGALAAGVRDLPAVYLGSIAATVGTGCTLLLVGLHRAAGRPGYDSWTFFALSAVQMVLLAGAAGGLLGPVGYLACLVAAQCLVNVALLGKLGRPSLRIRARAGYLRRVGWTALLMGSPDVCLYLCGSVLFAILAGTAWDKQVGALYVVSLVWSAGINFTLYVLRVYAPGTSLRLAGVHAVAGRRAAAKLARLVIPLELTWLAGLTVLMAETDLLDATRHGKALLWWVLLVATRTPAAVLLIYAGYLLENTDARAIRVTAVAAVASLVTAAGAGLALVPAYGGLGLLAALVLADLAQAFTLAGFGRRTPSLVPSRLWAGGKDNDVPA